MQYHIHTKFHNQGLTGLGFIMGRGQDFASLPKIFNVKKAKAG